MNLKSKKESICGLPYPALFVSILASLEVIIKLKTKIIMKIEDLEYLKQTLEFIRNNTELIDHNKNIETYGNNMMNCENIISRELSELTTKANSSEKATELITDVSGLLFEYEMRTNNNRIPTKSEALVKVQVKQFLENYNH